jgi:predicted nucleic acid-binding protein
MRFWDSSALVPLLIREPWSDQVRRLLADDGDIVASIITPIEIQSALWRRRHHGEMAADQHIAAEEAFAKLSESWSEINDLVEVRQVALDLITRHVLRAADALQLGTAIVASNGAPGSLPFVTFGLDLAAAARAEGFTVLPTDLP